MLWRCTICGYVHDGESSPGECPRCGSPGDKFDSVPEDKVKLINRARLTNGLHMEMHNKLKEALGLAEKGIEDNLDPGCVNIFTTVRDESFTLMQMIKAELEIHMGKGKWG